MNKLAIIIVSLVLVTAVGLGGCTSAPSVPALVAQKPNPPITVTLDKIGVHHNGEGGLRSLTAGEVYVHVVVTDGEITSELRFPSQEGQYYSLYPEETVNVNERLLYTSEVGDSLTITAIGYEADGGGFEQLIYQALGLAIGSQIGGGSGGVLAAFDLSLGDLIGKFTGVEHDPLGSYQRTWRKANNWGIGRYEDMVLEVNGVPSLRLWFTIENPEKPLSASSSTEEAASYESTTGSFSLGPGETLSVKQFHLEANNSGILYVIADKPVYLAGQESMAKGEVRVEVQPLRAMWIQAYEEVQREDDWFALIIIEPDISGTFDLVVTNDTNQPSEGRYILHN